MTTQDFGETGNDPTCRVFAARSVIGAVLLTPDMNLRLKRVSFVVERHEFVYNVRSSKIPNCGIAAAGMVVRERE